MTVGSSQNLCHPILLLMHSIVCAYKAKQFSSFHMTCMYLMRLHPMWTRHVAQNRGKKTSGKPRRHIQYIYYYPRILKCITKMSNMIQNFHNWSMWVLKNNNFVEKQEYICFWGLVAMKSNNACRVVMPNDYLCIPNWNWGDISFLIMKDPSMAWPQHRVVDTFHLAIGSSRHPNPTSLLPQLNRIATYSNLVGSLHALPNSQRIINKID